MHITPPPPSSRQARDGAAAVEFALVGPLLIVLIMGILSYGGYFWIAHSVQQMANDAARAAIAGLNQPEREALAWARVESAMHAHPTLSLDDADLDIVRTGQSLTVRVRYDARGSVFWVFDAIVPMPPKELERAATIQLGGF